MCSSRIVLNIFAPWKANIFRPASDFTFRDNKMCSFPRVVLKMFYFLKVHYEIRGCKTVQAFKDLSSTHILFLMWFIVGCLRLFLLSFIIFKYRIWMFSNSCFLEGDKSIKMFLQ